MAGGVILSLEGRVATLTVNRPEVRNALDAATVEEFHRALEGARAARCAVLIVTGAGDKAFVSGADVGAIRRRRRDDALASINSRLMSAVEAHDAVSIAAVNGYALGGGCELALACDLRLAAEEAVFGLPEPSLGIIPGAGGTQRLTRAVGKAIAMEMVLNNRFLSAEEAQQFGLVNRVLPLERYLEEAIRLAEEIAGRAPVAVRLAKEAINKAFETSLAEGVFVERRLFNLLFSTADQKEGMAAFIEKRPAEWKGR